MTNQPKSITVQIKYKALDETFVGTPEEVWSLLSKFFSEFIPFFEIADQLTLKVNVQDLAKDCEGIISFSKEGANVMVPRSKLTDNETLTLWLLASYLGKELEILKADTLHKEELQAKVGKDAKITSTRLGELVKSGIAVKFENENYGITTFGIVHAQRELLPKIRTKILA